MDSVSGGWLRLFWEIVCCNLILRVASPWGADCKPCQPGLYASTRCLYMAFQGSAGLVWVLQQGIKGQAWGSGVIKDGLICALECTILWKWNSRIISPLWDFFLRQSLQMVLGGLSMVLGLSECLTEQGQVLSHTKHRRYLKHHSDCSWVTFPLKLQGKHNSVGVFVSHCSHPHRFWDL